MAAIDLFVQSSEIALTAVTTWKTILLAKAATNQRLRVKRWGVYFDSAALGAGVESELVRASTTGTMSAATAVALSAGITETATTTFYHTATVEPTPGDVLDVVEGAFDVIYPLGQEPIVEGGGHISIRCRSDGSVNVRAKLVIEE
jgi:hypothetical protein